MCVLLSIWGLCLYRYPVFHKTGVVGQFLTGIKIIVFMFKLY